MSRRVVHKLTAAPPLSGLEKDERRSRLLKYMTWTEQESVEFDRILADMREFTADSAAALDISRRLI